eukprot:3434603-Rhodomonas_salina.1
MEVHDSCIWSCSSRRTCFSTRLPATPSMAKSPPPPSPLPLSFSPSPPPLSSHLLNDDAPLPPSLPPAHPPRGIT